MFGDKQIIETKLDHNTLHCVPFVASRKRTKIKMIKNWGNTKIEISAPEAANDYDLITLMFICRAYLKENYKGGFIGGENDKKIEIAKIELDLEEICNKRERINNKTNRGTIYNSLLRISNMNLIFDIKFIDKKIITKYLYQIEIDNSYKKATIYANKLFIDSLIKKGISLNLSNFIKLEQTKNNGYAILLYAFLSGTKTKTKWNNRTILKWREKYSEELLFDSINLNLTKLPLKRKREELKKAFIILNKELQLPLYHFDGKIWIRTDLAKKRQEKVK